MTGPRARPPTRLASAPSIPATTTTHSACSRSVSAVASRCTPATPTSCRSEKLRADPNLAHDGAVRGSGRDHGDEPPRLGNAAGDPDAARERILLGFGNDLADGGPRRVVCPRREDASRAAFEECNEDLRDLLRGLSLGENGLGRTLSKLPVKVDSREPEISVRQLGETFQRVVGARRPGPHTFEKVAEIVAEPGHRAIVGGEH